MHESRTIGFSDLRNQIRYYVPFYSLLDQIPPFPFHHHIFLASAKISSVAFSLNIIVGRTGNAPGTTGKLLASTTRRPFTPRTLNFASNTAILSLSAPIAQVDVA